MPWVTRDPVSRLTTEIRRIDFSMPESLWKVSHFRGTEWDFVHLETALTFCQTPDLAAQPLSHAAALSRRVGFWLTVTTGGPHGRLGRATYARALARVTAISAVREGKCVAVSWLSRQAVEREQEGER